MDRVVSYENSKKKGQRCCVWKCNSDSITSKGISFHLFPKDEKLRKIWISRVNIGSPRGKYSLWTPTKYHKICGLHFNRSGKKKREDTIPCFFPNKIFPDFSSDSELSTPNEDFINGTDIKKETNPFLNVKIESDVLRPSTEDDWRDHLKDHNYSLQDNNDSATLIKGLKQEIQDLKEKLSKNINLEKQVKISKQQTNNLFKELEKKNNIIVKKTMEINKLISKLGEYRSPQTRYFTYLQDDKLIHLYTGFKDGQSFRLFIKFISKPYSEMKTTNLGRPHKLTIEEEAFLVLSKLRLDLLEEDLAYRFQMSQSSISNIVRNWLDFLNSFFSSLNMWPSRNLVNASMPDLFEKYPNTRIIIDCMDIFMEKPSNRKLLKEIYSPYKNYNTAKGLIAIAPNGHISFVSDIYGGHVCDKEIFMKSGILAKLQAGDSVIADKGFPICNELNEIGVELIEFPKFSTSNRTFSEKVTEASDIASMHKHVERVFSEIKNWKILKTIIPTIGSANSAYMSKLWKVCCYLQNFVNEPLLNREV